MSSKTAILFLLSPIVAPVFAMLACSTSPERDMSKDQDASVAEAGKDSAVTPPVKDAAGVEAGDEGGVGCPKECEAQDAQGSGDTTCPIGYKWSGTDCILLRGCGGCKGADCGKLMKYDECQKLAVDCAIKCPL